MNRQISENLAQQVLEAIGATSCCLWLFNAGEWALWHCAGIAVADEESQRRPLEELGRGATVSSGGGWTSIALPGAGGVLGALTMSGEASLDEVSRQLLGAICGTAGMLLDKGLRMESLARDPVTGLLPKDGFLERAGPELRQVARRISWLSPGSS